MASATRRLKPAPTSRYLIVALYQYSQGRAATEIAKYSLFVIYLAALVMLFIYGINCHVLMFLHRINRRRAEGREPVLRELFLAHVARTGLPRVTIQLPVYNEQYVVERLLRAITGIAYPKDLMEIQVLDDSTDETVELVSEIIEDYRNQGFDITQIRRKNRKGYKAGALAEGLVRAKGEFIAIFDADFVPHPEFLDKTLSYFVDPRVAVVQARWGHTNPDYSLLTRAQSMGIDGHFGVEQPARAWSGLFLNFNGTAGIWRKEAILDAGGWQCDTLTEDMDLSYRAQLKGWKLEFAYGHVCPAELPVQIHAFKAQQHRWAKGSIQTARKLLGRIVRARIPFAVKIEAVLHLTHYIVHPLMITVVLTSLPMSFTAWFDTRASYSLSLFSLVALATCGPSSLYLYSQRLLYRDWPRRLRFLPLLICLGTGIAVNNTKAVIEAFGRGTGAFVRTPKYNIFSRADNWRKKSYRAPEGLVPVFELLTGCYALTSLVLFVMQKRYFISPFLLIYTLGFFYVFVLSLSHSTGYGKKRGRAKWSTEKPPRLFSLE